ncbi:recombination regulator RecX [Companilactobacillus metriopterae]|uniref:recombination regulator RecX n=1 Tax=Companilactobacillus metriopterae TaxID=1909267 RepID=UPI00100A3C55|nr:recombination regulator RecX [Companilactobacillus metriopterae]
MAKVTLIQAQKQKGRYNVFIDNKFAFGVSENTLIDFRLAKNLELDDNQIEEIKNRENINKAYGDAVNYLSYQLRTEFELKKYLKEKEYDLDTIDEVLERLRSLHYVDDDNYAKTYIHSQLNTSNNGPKIMEQKLIQKGVSKFVIEDQLAEIDQDILIENAVDFAKKQIKKSRKNSFSNMQQKIKQTLYQKGFSNEIIDEAISKIDLQKDDETELENLKAMINKVQKRYPDKNKLITYLMTKGFKYQDIKNELE